MRNLSCIPILVVALIVACLPVQAQEPDPLVTWQTLVNEARLDEGLAPYDLSTQLRDAAQRHADDLAANPISSHVGSDDSQPAQRIKEAHYNAWTWADGAPIVGENFWTGYGAIEDALAFFLEDPTHRDNILSPTYREMGIGIATDANGRYYYVLDFGARPNVLPVFLNDGAANTDDPQIAIRLTNEEARPEGEGTIFMGRAIEIRISNEPNLENSAWQPWEPLVPWDLPNIPEEHTVYVQFRDAAGRTAGATDSIILGAGTVAAPTPIPATPTAEPTATPEPAGTPPPPPVNQTEGSTVLFEAPAITEPTATPEIPAPVLPDSITTPFPTWTPLPTITSQGTDAPEISPPWLAALQRSIFPLLASLQGIVLLLGIYLILRRGGGSTGRDL
jgi:hypothetical protein